MKNDGLVSLNVGKGLLVLTFDEYQRGLRRGQTVIDNRRYAKQRKDIESGKSEKANG